MNRGRTKGAAIKPAQRRSADSSQNSADEAGQSNGGRGWHGDPQGHAVAGSKGGRKVSQDREHMASIGRKGGQTVSRDREHMAEIGRKGGQARSEAVGEPSEDRSHANR